MGSSVPSVSRLRLLAKVPGLLRHRPEAFRAIAAEYGDCVRIPIPGRPLYLLSSPAYVQQVLQKNHANWKSFDYRIVRSFLGEGLVTSQGETWKCGRAAAQPSFHRERVESRAPAIVSAACAELEQWRTRARGSPVMPALALSRRLGLRVFVQALFGVDASAAELDEVLELVEEALRHLDQRLAAPFDWVGKVRVLRRRRFERRKQALEAVVGRWVSRRREGGEGGDFLSDLLRAYDQGLGAQPAAAPLVDQLVTFLVAGHETTAACLAWTLYLLAKHPSVQERLRGDIEAGLAGRAPGQDDPAKLPRVRHVLQESMRLYPPIWSIGRDALGEDVFEEPGGGFRLPRGAAVVISPYVLHRKSEHWESPDEFNPDRFAPGAARRPVPFSYLPFSAGPRHCIGEKFAWLELELMLILILQRFELSPAWAAEPELEAVFSLRPRPDISLRVEPREP